MNTHVLMALVVAVACAGCWDPTLPSTTQAEQSSAERLARFVVVDPSPSNGVRPLSRFSFELPVGAAVESLRLYRGELSDYHQQRIIKSELPNTLLEREVAVLTWPQGRADAGSTQQVASQAQAPLEPGASYTWALLGQGPLLSFAVGDELPMDWTRLWPTAEGGFGGYVAYCQKSHGVASDGGTRTPPRSLETLVTDWVFEPGANAVTVQPGLGLLDIGGNGCVHFEIDSDPLPELLVPPLAVAGSTVDPAPLRTQRDDAVQPVRCEDDWRQLGPGCIQVLDDRIEIVSPSSPTLWLLGSSDVQFYGVEDGRFVVRGFAPAHEQILEFVSYSSEGRRYQGRMELTTAAARPHVVINEVLANPLAAEPAQEWVELYNGGSSTSDLEGWILSDGAGHGVLPAVSLGPGEYLVVVSEQYGDGVGDVAIPESARIVRVAALGVNGLSNSGEELQLLSESGQLQSRFAARAASVAGVSIARVEPEAPDDDAASFARHGEPGASPGTANTFAMLH